MPGMQSTIGDYRIVARIDEGGMGAVFRAQHVSLGHEVAIKLLPTTLASDATAQQWFRRGAASAAALQHPNILPVYHYGEHDGAPYLVMPYIAGGTLKDRLLRGPLSFAEIVSVMEQLAAALDYAHSKGVIHRDVKPANLLLDGRGQLYLADFGIARALESATRFTRTGTTIGTPEYMAPEQARGQADHRSDLYAAGIILYQLLTGQVPFSGDSAVEILMQHIQDPLPLEPVRAVRPSLPAAIEPIIARALAKQPDARYQRGADLVADLAAALAGASERPDAWQPDNQPTIFAGNTGNDVIAPRTPAPRVALGTTPVPYVAPVAIPAPYISAPASAPVGPRRQGGNRPPPPNPFLVILSAGLAAILLLTSVVGVGAWATNRSDTATSTKVVAQIPPTATVTSTPQPTSTAMPTSTSTATQQPTNTPTPRPTNTPTRVPTNTPTATPTKRTPAGQPPGQDWQSYLGQTSAPFAIYIPANWTIDTSQAANGSVVFWGPNKSAYLRIATIGKAPGGTTIDSLRNDQLNEAITDCIGAKTCSLGSVKKTGYDALNPTFAWFLTTITYSNGAVSDLRDGIATKDGIMWVYNFEVSQRDQASNDAAWNAFGGIISSLNVYANP